MEKRYFTSDLSSLSWSSLVRRALRYHRASSSSRVSRGRLGGGFRFSMTYSPGRRPVSGGPGFLTKTWYVTASQAL